MSRINPFDDDRRINSHSGRYADIVTTDSGDYTYFAFCALFGLATLAFLGWGMSKPRHSRIFHYIMAAICAISFISYFVMGADLGWTGVRPRHNLDASESESDGEIGSYRQIFYTRFIDWFLTWALVVLALMLTARAPWFQILWTILVTWIAAVCFLIGALTSTRYKWAFFVFGCMAILYVIYKLLFQARRHAKFFGTDVGKTFFVGAAWTAFIWVMYPICWALSEGGNVINPNSTAIFYSILDFLFKVVFGFVFLTLHRTIDPARLGLRLRGFDEGPHVGHHGDKTTGTHGSVPVGGATTTTTSTV